MRIYEESVSFVRPTPKFGAKLAMFWHLGIFVFRAHIFPFQWELADEERSRGENQKKSNFSDTQQVWTTR